MADGLHHDTDCSVQVRWDTADQAPAGQPGRVSLGEACCGVDVFGERDIRKHIYHIHQRHQHTSEDERLLPAGR